jgi:hypothetical protein
MTTRISQCAFCVHFHGENLLRETCDAFPWGIPEVIVFGPYDHRLPYPGDRGIRYRGVARRHPFGPQPDNPPPGPYPSPPSMPEAADVIRYLCMRGGQDLRSHQKELLRNQIPLTEPRWIGGFAPEASGDGVRWTETIQLPRFTDGRGKDLGSIEAAAVRGFAEAMLSPTDLSNPEQLDPDCWHGEAGELSESTPSLVYFGIVYASLEFVLAYEIPGATCTGAWCHFGATSSRPIGLQGLSTQKNSHSTALLTLAALVLHVRAEMSPANIGSVPVAAGRMSVKCLSDGRHGLFGSSECRSGDGFKCCAGNAVQS